MNNKSIRMVVSLSLNALFIAIAVVVVVMFGTKAYTFGNNIFNEKSVDTVDNAKVVEVTIASSLLYSIYSGLSFIALLSSSFNCSILCINISHYN